MSTFSSLCHKDDGDKIDVAYCFVDDVVRVIIWEDEDGNQAEAYLSKEETRHLIDLLKIAEERI